MLNRIYRFILRRKSYKGQFKLFLWLFHRNKFQEITTITEPLNSNFKLNINTKNYIEASIYFTGDYEDYVKNVFKNYVNPGDVVLDVGANIGFHSLYFAELVGEKGRVYSFEPMPVNFNSLQKNIELNGVTNVNTIKKALGNDNKLIKIHLDESQVNKGAYNLFDEGPKNTEIEIVSGDRFVESENIDVINFIKIDVEGSELSVIQGLMLNIEKSKPTIVFEYDRHYQLKAGNNGTEIFGLLRKLGYAFALITNNGLTSYDDTNYTVSGNILAISNS